MFFEYFSKRKQKSHKQRRLTLENLETRALLSASPGSHYSYGGGGYGYGYSSQALNNTAAEFYVAVGWQIQSGTQTTVKLYAEDSYGRLAAGYDGTVKLSSSDSKATLPSTVTFQNGVATIQAAFATPGQQTITATDSTSSSLTGTATTTVIAPAVASLFYVELRPAAQAGVQTTVQIAALDQYGNVVRNYDGTADLTSTDSAAKFPATVTFQNGWATFQVTFGTAGTQSITATDSKSSSLTGSATTSVAPADVASQYSFSLPSTVHSGSPVSVELFALDSSGNVVRGYTGTVKITSSDTAAKLPSSITFQNGVANFQVTFNTTGTESITATDASGVVKAVTASTNVLAARSTSPSPTPTPTPTPNPGASAQGATTSTNWSGYAAETSLRSPQTGSVTAVSGSWTVPAASGSGTAYSAVWVGIDGYQSSSVEQIGTEQDVVNGQAQYSIWYEMYPLGSVTITTMTIKPGDSITASVQYTNSQFVLTITDTSQGNDSFTTTQSASGAQRSSVEWIVEAPSSNYGVLPLANFGTVAFSNATATINGTTGAINNSAWQSTAINIVSYGNQLQATTSSLTNTTASPLSSSFTVAFDAAGSSTSPGPSSYGLGGGYGGGGGSGYWRKPSSVAHFSAAGAYSSVTSSSTDSGDLQAARDRFFETLDVGNG
jgi:hypothetical protein